MRKILLALGFCVAASAANATCTSPISSLNSTGSTITLGATVDASNNCWGGTAIVDGTAAANKMAVKAASTAPLAADPAAVVALSPNSVGGVVGTPLFAQITTGAAVIGSISNTSFIATQATAANLNATVVGTGTFAVQAASTLNAETTKVIGTVRTLGNVGAVIDFAGQNASSPANAWLVGAQFQTTPTTITPGNASPLQMDNAGNLLVNIKAGAGSGGTALGDNAAWTAGTTSMTPAGCEFTTGGATAITTAHAATVGCTAARAMFTDLESVAATTLGTPAAYGSTPTGNALSANVFVTNTNTNGSATSANSSPVVIASDQAAVAVKAASGAFASGSVASGAIASGAVASGAFASGSFVNATAGDPCMFQAKTNVPISTASGTTALVTGVSAKKVYVCSLFLISPTAISVSLSEGSGTTCGTSAQAGVIGVATNGTAANGVPLAANGGFTLGNGGGVVAETATAANYLCLFQSGTAQLAGNLTYVQQ